VRSYVESETPALYELREHTNRDPNLTSLGRVAYGLAVPKARVYSRTVREALMVGVDRVSM